MKTRVLKKILTTVLAATLAFTSVVPAYAAEDTALVQDTDDEGSDVSDAGGQSSTVSAEDISAGKENAGIETTPDAGDSTTPVTPAQTEDGQNDKGTSADDADEQQNIDGQDQSAVSADEENANKEDGKSAENADESEEDADEADEDAENEDDDEDTEEEPEAVSEDSDLVGNNGSVEITFNYYTIYDETDETKTILYESITKTVPLGLEEGSDEARRAYVYPYVDSPAYDIYVFDCWADAPDTDMEKDWNNTPYDERGNWIALNDQFYVIDPELYKETGSGIINVYAQWKLGDGEVEVEIHAGTNGRYSDSHNYLKTLKVGMPFRFLEGRDGAYSVGFIANEGYYFDGIYLDEGCNTPFPMSLYEYSNYEDYIITQELLDTYVTSVEDGGDGKLHIYVKWTFIKVSKITVYGYGNNKIVLTGEYDLTDVIPAEITDIESTGPSNYSFQGYYASSPDHYYEYVEVVPGETRFNEINVSRNYSDSSSQRTYSVAIDTRWRDENSYKVIFHLNNGTDAKATKTYKTEDRTTLLDLKTGALSQDSSVSGFEGFVAWTTKDGKAFGKTQTVGDLMYYMKSNKLTSIDLYAVWDKGEYTVLFDANLDGGSLDAASAFADGHKETVNIDETYILTGKEFVRKGYTLDHWEYAAGKETKKLKITQTFKNLAADNGTITLKAIWKKQTYTVKLNANGGTLAEGAVASFTYDAETAGITDGINLPAVTKTGYRFDGWVEGTTPYTHYGNDIYKNLSLTAKWTPYTYTLVIDSDQGVINKTEGQDKVTLESIAYDKVINLGSYKAAKAGYTFVNWKVADKTYKATQKVSKLTATDEDEVTLVAQWKPNTYKITYNYNGGSVPKGTSNPASFVYGTGVETSGIIAPTRTGYSFDGWSIIIKGADNGKLGGKLDVPGAVTLKANWKALWYKVNIVAEFPENDEVRRDDLPAYEYSKSVNFNLVLRGMDAAKDHSIKGLAFTADARTAKYENSKLIKVADLVKDAVAADALAPAPADSFYAGVITLYAVLDPAPKTYYIDYNGEMLSKYIYTYKFSTRDTTLPNGVKKGYDFIGWEIDTDPEYDIGWEATAGLTLDNFVTRKVTVEGEEITVITGIKAGTAANIKLKARYEVKTYNIKLNPNAKDVKKGDAAVKTALWMKDANNAYVFGYDGTSAENLTVENLNNATEWTRTGYNFEGWGLKANAKAEDAISSFAELTTGNTATLYAIWTAQTPAITYLNSYTLVGSEEYIFDNAEETLKITDDFGGTAAYAFGKAISLKKVSATGYTFKGWKQVDGDPADGVVIKNGYVTGIKKDNTAVHTFYAVFDENTYNIKLNTQGGTMYNYLITKSDKKFKGTQVIARDKKYTGTVDELEYSARYRSKKGYVFAGIATDSKGKNLIIGSDGYIIPDENGMSWITAKNRGFSVKNKGTITLYAIWNKVGAAAVTGVTAGYEGGNANRLTVTATSNAGSSEKIIYEIKYSTSMLFTKTTTVTTTVNGSNTASAVFTPDYGTGFYVKVRTGRKDSAGNYVYSKWSSTARASKTATE